mgnify:FL=1
MLDQDLEQRLNNQDELLAKIYRSVEKTRKYFLWTLIATLAMFVIPLLAMIVVLPWFMNSYFDAYKDVLGGL